MARSRSERMWLVGAAFAALIIAVVGWFFLISPERQTDSKVRGEITGTQQSNNALQFRASQLAAEKQKLPTYQRDLATARRALPAAKDMSAFLRSLQQIAASTSTKLTALMVNDPVAVTPDAAGGAAPSASASPSAAPAAPGAAPTQAASLFSVPITVSVIGTPRALTAFLTQLQAHQPRAVLVSKIDRRPDSDKPGATSTLQLTMSAFVASTAAPAAAAGTSSAAPTPGG